MQNIVYERKQNGEDFFSLPAVTCFRFGNCPANCLVTEQPQYSVAICIFSIWQNTEILLISNDLRFVLTCSLLLALTWIFHLARHSFATEICLTKGVPIESVAKMLGHTNIQTTQIYARVVDRKLSHDMNMLDRKLKSMQKSTVQNAV